MLQIIVHDSLGIETGIKVTDVRSVLDRDGDAIDIRGHLLSTDHIAVPGLEPDLQCDIINSENQVCFSAVSVHQGIYSVTKKVTFTLHIEAVSRSINWSEIAKINLYVVFRRSG